MIYGYQHNKTETNFWEEHIFPAFSFMDLHLKNEENWQRSLKTSIFILKCSSSQKKKKLESLSNSF